MLSMLSTPSSGICADLSRPRPMRAFCSECRAPMDRRVFFPNPTNRPDEWRCRTRGCYGSPVFEQVGQGAQGGGEHMNPTRGLAGVSFGMALNRPTPPRGG